MLLKFKNLTIRSATMEDAQQLAIWWNDGTIMAHAGFPKGTGQKATDIRDLLKRDTNTSQQHLIIELTQKPIGEMSYCKKDKHTVEIAIKICDFSLHNKGLGTKCLSMLISSLFSDLGYKKIILNTNLHNKKAQHVYEKLGFKKIQVRKNSWKNQLGEWQSSIDYELYQKDFINFNK